MGLRHIVLTSIGRVGPEPWRQRRLVKCRGKPAADPTYRSGVCRLEVTEAADTRQAGHCPTVYGQTCVMGGSHQPGAVGHDKLHVRGAARRKTRGLLRVGWFWLL